MERPSFKRNTEVYPNYNVIYPLSKPNRRGNNEMYRNSFLREPIKRRGSIDFDRLQREENTKIQLSDKTLDKLFSVKIDDPTDIEWIQEHRRLMALGYSKDDLKHMLPLGRPQRKVTKRVTFGEHGLTTGDKLEHLKTAIAQNTDKTKEGTALIVAELARILSKPLTEEETKEAGDVLEAVKEHIPDDYRAVMGGKRYITGEDYYKNNGMIDLFILAHAEDRDKPGTTSDDEKRPLASIAQLLRKKRGGLGYNNALDLETLRIVSVADIGEARAETDKPRRKKKAPQRRMDEFFND